MRRKTNPPTVVLYLRVPAEVKEAIGEAATKRYEVARQEGRWEPRLTANDMAIELIRSGLIVATAPAAKRKAPSKAARK